MNPRRGILSSLLAVGAMFGISAGAHLPPPPPPRPDPEPPPPDPKPEPLAEIVIPPGSILIPEYAAVAADRQPTIAVNAKAPTTAERAAAEKRARRASRKNPSAYSLSNA